MNAGYLHPCAHLVARAPGDGRWRDNLAHYRLPVLIAAALGWVTPCEAGTGWNGFYVLITGAILSL